MLATKLNVGFYGHVRQYHNLKAEIDTKIHEVLESGQYVLGPTLKKFEAELAEFHGTKYAIGGGQVPLPLSGAMDEVHALSARLAGRKVLLSAPLNAKEYTPVKAVPEATSVR